LYPVGGIFPDADSVLASINSPILDSPAPEYKVRGWFIEGDTDAPLIIISVGHATSLTGGPDPNTLNSSVQHRKLAYYLAIQGYNVLIYDYLGRGVSGGWNRFSDYTPLEHDAMPGLNETYETGNAPNLFYMVHQLAGNAYPAAGHTMTYISPDPNNPGQFLPGTNPLISSANIPVVLYGFSHGTSISGIAMALNFDGANQFPGTGPSPRASALEAKLNIKGYVENGGNASGRYNIINLFPFDPRFNGVWAPDLGALGSGWNMLWNGMLSEDSCDVFWPREILASADKWPAYLGLHGAADEFVVAQSCIETFNRVNGTKDLVILPGFHYDVLGEDVENPTILSNFPYVLKKISMFCRRALNSSSQDNSITTLQEQVCRAPVLGKSVPAAHNWFERLEKKYEQ
jgi:hypothetical protein